MTAELDGPRQAPATGGAPDALVALLHGYGSNGHDLIQLAPHLARSLPGAAFVSPHAPFALNMPGAPVEARQWFPINRIDPVEMEAGVRRAAPILDAFLDAELARHGLGAERLALVGFSQGSMMSLHVAPRRAVAPFAVVGLSGALCGPEALKTEAVSAPPVLLIHGDRDDVVPVSMMREAAEGLAAAGLAPRFHVSPGVPHAVGPDGLALTARFLADHLAAVAAPAS